jgi:hypothetical protein
MGQRCSYCGIPAAGHASCPVCGTRLVAVNFRRILLWGLVVEEYLVALVVMLRFS